MSIKPALARSADADMISCICSCVLPAPANIVMYSCIKTLSCPVNVCMLSAYSFNCCTLLLSRYGLFFEALSSIFSLLICPLYASVTSLTPAAMALIDTAAAAAVTPALPAVLAKSFSLLPESLSPLSSPLLFNSVSIVTLPSAILTLQTYQRSL